MLVDLCPLAYGRHGAAGQATDMWSGPSVEVRLVLRHLQLLVFSELLRPMLIRGLAETARVVWRTILEMGRREVWGRTCQGAAGYRVLMGSKRVRVAAKTMILMLAAQMETLMPVTLVPEAFVQSHLGLECVASTV